MASQAYIQAGIAHASVELLLKTPSLCIPQPNSFITMKNF